jgi:hypothetical protein
MTGEAEGGVSPVVDPGFPIEHVATGMLLVGRCPQGVRESHLCPTCVRAAVGACDGLARRDALAWAALKSSGQFLAEQWEILERSPFFDPVLSVLLPSSMCFVSETLMLRCAASGGAWTVYEQPRLSVCVSHERSGRYSWRVELFGSPWAPVTERVVHVRVHLGRAAATVLERGVERVISVPASLPADIDSRVAVGLIARAYAYFGDALIVRQETT